MLVAVFVIGWGFGLYYLFKTKNWDALTRRLPLALCALVVVQVGLSTISSSGAFQSLLGVVAIAILLIGTALPALSGVMLWIGRQSPARMWAAEQLTRGRVFAQAVSISIVEGVSGGAAMAAIGVLADWAALNVAGVRAVDLARAEYRRRRHRLDDRRHAAADRRSSSWRSRSRSKCSIGFASTPMALDRGRGDRGRPGGGADQESILPG